MKKQRDTKKDLLPSEVDIGYVVNGGASSLKRCGFCIYSNLQVSEALHLVSCRVSGVPRWRGIDDTCKYCEVYPSLRENDGDKFIEHKYSYTLNGETYFTLLTDDEKRKFEAKYEVCLSKCD